MQGVCDGLLGVGPAGLIVSRLALVEMQGSGGWGGRGWGGAVAGLGVAALASTRWHCFDP